MLIEIPNYRQRHRATDAPQDNLLALTTVIPLGLPLSEVILESYFRHRPLLPSWLWGKNCAKHFPSAGWVVSQAKAPGSTAPSHLPIKVSVPSATCCPWWVPPALSMALHWALEALCLLSLLNPQDPACANVTAMPITSATLDWVSSRAITAQELWPHVPL